MKNYWHKIGKVSLWMAAPLVGFLFAWRLSLVPSRAETALFLATVVMVPSFIYPKLAMYYILVVPCFMPMFRRIYYLIAERPDIDYIMLITDGAMVSLFVAIIMLWVKNKEKNRDRLSFWMLFFFALLILKIFLIQKSSVMDGLYAFKYYVVYIPFYFSAAYLVNNRREFQRCLGVMLITYLVVALYSLKQVYLGFAEFEELWVESVEFTTLLIEGHIRTFSTLISPQALADAMSLGIILGMYFIVSSKMPLRLFALGATVIFLFPLLFATVRTNWIASLFSIWIFIYSLTQFKKIPTLLNFILIPVLITGLLTFGDNSSDTDNRRAQKNFTENSSSITEVMIANRTSALTNPLEEYSMQKRIITWGAIFNETINHYPLGSGLGTTGYAHSFYMTILGETGFPGLLLYLGILIALFYRSVKLIRTVQDRKEREIIATFFTIFITVFILNLTGNHLNSHPLDICYWFSCGGISHFYAKYFVFKTAKITSPDKEQEQVPLLPLEAFRNV